MNNPLTLLLIDRSLSLFDNLVSDTALSSLHLLYIENTDSALQKLNETHVDIIVLDYENNTEHEASFIANLRSSENLALVLILSAITSSTESVKCLNAGADDFMFKPYQYSELVARISSLARNAISSKMITRQRSQGRLQLDPNILNASYKSCDLHLTKTEFRVLDAIKRREGRPVSHETLIEELYGCEFGLTRNSIEVHISAIRRKLTKAGAPATVHTRRGFGYFIE